MIKHVGKVGDRKVAIVFRQIPGERAYVLGIVYPDTMRQDMHDSLMSAIESHQKDKPQLI